MTKAKVKTLSKEKFNAFVHTLIETDAYTVCGVKEKGDKFVFDCLDAADELRLDYDTTILPPKKYFLPQYETILQYDLRNPTKVTAPSDSPTRILIGVHPYDIIAMQQMDTYYLDTDASESYLQKRKHTLIVGSDVLTVSEKAFFGAMGTGSVDSGYDLFLTDLGDSVVITIGSPEGEALLTHATGLADATDADIKEVSRIRTVAQQKAMRDLQCPPQQWHDLLHHNYKSAVWKEQSDKCLACGTCTLVCPTCFCYDVTDEVNIDMKTGRRIRTWDGCLLRQFTEVASGEIFREDIVDRYRHRYFRKGNYLPDRLGFVACVGCGRCSSQCVPDIADPVTVINKLARSTTVSLAEVPMTATSVGITAKEVDAGLDLHEPRPATIQRVEQLTEKEMLFEVKLDSGKSLGHEPGQFVEVSIVGTGEAPISVSSPPGGTTFELVVRKLGDVTSKLHTMKKGDALGIRGPFGVGFNVDDLKGKDLLFIAAGLGIAPLRSLFNHVIDPTHRKSFGDITILYGCKEPCEMLFNQEVQRWDTRDDITHLLTVDACPEGVCWEGDIGVVGSLIPKVKMDLTSTIAILVGPPIVYRFVIADLKKAGMPEENIIVSLERRMKCGVGKCGHCQINNLYCCKDGPVFWYKDIKDLPEAFT